MLVVRDINTRAPPWQYMNTHGLPMDPQPNTPGTIRGKLGKDTVDGRNPAPPKGWLKPYKLDNGILPT